MNIIYTWSDPTLHIFFTTLHDGCHPNGKSSEMRTSINIPSQNFLVEKIFFIATRLDFVNIHMEEYTGMTTFYIKSVQKCFWISNSHQPDRNNP